MPKSKAKPAIRVTGKTGDYKMKSGKRVISTHKKKSTATKAAKALRARRKKK
jgi:hypothetical protein